MYTDNVYGHSSHALFWATMGEGAGRMAQKERYIDWQRASDAYGGSQYSLFGDSGVKVTDIK